MTNEIKRIENANSEFRQREETMKWNAMTLNAYSAEIILVSAKCLHERWTNECDDRVSTCEVRTSDEISSLLAQKKTLIISHGKQSIYRENFGFCAKKCSDKLRMHQICFHEICFNFKTLDEPIKSKEEQQKWSSKENKLESGCSKKQVIKSENSHWHKVNEVTKSNKDNEHI